MKKVFKGLLVVTVVMLFSLGSVFAYNKWQGSDEVSSSHDKIKIINALFKDKNKTIDDLEKEIKDIVKNTIDKKEHDKIVQGYEDQLEQAYKDVLGINKELDKTIEGANKW